MKKITDFDVSLDIQNILMLMDCPKEHELYEQILQELTEIQETIEHSLSPVALLSLGTIPKEAIYGDFAGKKALFSIISVGKSISTLSTTAFTQGDYVKGMLYDKAADSYLFSLEKPLSDSIKAICKEHSVGISQRLESPNDIHLKINTTAIEVTNAKNEGFDITCGYMIDPVKSCTTVYILDDNVHMFNVDHNCEQCPLIHCSMRKTATCSVTVVCDESSKTFTVIKGQSLLSVLQENAVYLESPCGGSGICGKCEIELIGGYIQPSQEDEKFFTKKELQKGKRLSCTAYPKENCIIKIKNTDKTICTCDSQDSVLKNTNNTPCVIAIDIGTTTIAMQAINTTTKETINTICTVNHQRQFGLDIISRIKASNEGNSKALQRTIKDDITHGIKTLTNNYSIDIEKIVIAANTTMIHLLCGFSCESLGAIPFTSDHTDAILCTAKELLPSIPYNCNCEILPSICAFVGADIVAGLLYCNFLEKKEISILIDLGTNGEIAIGNRDSILVTSSAAGPAFEAGNIQNGCASIEGAITRVKITEKKIESIHTIHNKKAIGICGTGAISIIAELIRNDILDETGLLDDEYFDNGFPIFEDIVFTQKDIREIQLAKSAVRAALESLLTEFGIHAEDIETVYIAGAFGHALSIEDAITIGLFPKSLESKITTIGNSSLHGARMVALRNEYREKTHKIQAISKEVNLVKNASFTENFMNYIIFSNKGDFS